MYVHIGANIYIHATQKKSYMYPVLLKYAVNFILIKRRN